MSLKLNVGICKKLGQPDFSSLGASCNVELELDPSLIFDDVASFQERVQRAYAACRQAVDAELGRLQATTDEPATNGKAVSPASASTPTNGSNGHQASQKQFTYAKQLAGQIQGLGSRRLETLASKMFSKPMADFSSLEASGLIDLLKSIKAGKIELATALNGEVA